MSRSQPESKPPWRVGVDVVSRDKREKVWADAVIERGVFTDGERAWIAEPGGGVERALILISAKESSIKAMGGRSAGWNWQDIELVPGPAESRHLDLLDEALRLLAGDRATGRGALTTTAAVAQFAAECIDVGNDEDVQFTAVWACNDRWIATATVLERA